MEENHTNQLLCSCGVGVECQCAEKGPDLLLDVCVHACVRGGVPTCPAAVNAEMCPRVGVRGE